MQAKAALAIKGKQIIATYRRFTFDNKTRRTVTFKVQVFQSQNTCTLNRKHSTRLIPLRDERRDLRHKSVAISCFSCSKDFNPCLNPIDSQQNYFFHFLFTMLISHSFLQLCLPPMRAGESKRSICTQHTHTHKSFVAHKSVQLRATKDNCCCSEKLANCESHKI